MSRTIVVVPCFNEARRLNMRAIQEYGRRGDGAQLLFVDDGSSDETLELLAHLHGNNPNCFSFLRLERNGGKAEAVRQGMLRALQSTPDYIGFWDADLATPLADIEPFCRVLDAKPNIELVIGTRMRLLGHKIDRRPLRYWLGRLFANTASLALGVRVFDTQCGAKLFRVTPHLPQLLDRPFMTRWIFDVEIMARIARARRGSTLAPLCEILYELPLDSWQDVAGSTVTGGDFLKAIGEMSRIYWTYLRPGLRSPAREAPAQDAWLPDAPPVDARGDRQQAA
jgi:glycosyltransferase involved in cell wall biosynthesis